VREAVTRRSEDSLQSPGLSPKRLTIGGTVTKILLFYRLFMQYSVGGDAAAKARLQRKIPPRLALDFTSTTISQRRLLTYGPRQGLSPQDPIMLWQGDDMGSVGML